MCTLRPFPAPFAWRRATKRGEQQTVSSHSDALKGAALGVETEQTLIFLLAEPRRDMSGFEDEAAKEPSA